MAESGALGFDVASTLYLGARSRQEDALAVAFPDGGDSGFAIVSDGMGGHASGDVASRVIVAEMFSQLTLADRKDPEGISAVLRDAITRANTALGRHVASDTKQLGMGGTLVAVSVEKDRLHWISVGDSVLYLLRGDALTRLNADHSMAPQIDLMCARGMLTEEEARDHPQRNVLTAALMGGEIAEVDCPEEATRLEADDILILASDGLQFLPDPIIEALVLRARRDGSRMMAHDLIDALKTMNDPEQDNVGIVVIQVQKAKKAARPNPIVSTSHAVARAFRRAVTAPLPMNARR